jgi:hypothetical protein
MKRAERTISRRASFQLHTVPSRRCFNSIRRLVHQTRNQFLCRFVLSSTCASILLHQQYPKPRSTSKTTSVCWIALPSASRTSPRLHRPPSFLYLYVLRILRSSLASPLASPLAICKIGGGSVLLLPPPIPSSSSLN